MQILLRYYGIVGDLIEPRVDAVTMHDGATLSDVIAKIAQQSGTNAAILRQTSSLVDGQTVDRSTVLSDGVTVSFMRPISGG